LYVSTSPIGNIYVTGPRAIWVIDTRGRHIGVIRLPDIAANLNWAGSDWRDLYWTCSTSIYRVRRQVGGSPVASMQMR